MRCDRTPRQISQMAGDAKDQCWDGGTIFLCTELIVSSEKGGTVANQLCMCVCWWERGGLRNCHTSQTVATKLCNPIRQQVIILLLPCKLNCPTPIPNP